MGRHSNTSETKGNSHDQTSIKNKRNKNILGRKQLLTRIHHYKKSNPFPFVKGEAILLPRNRMRDMENFAKDFFEDPENQKAVYHQKVSIHNSIYEIYSIKVHEKIMILVYLKDKINEIFQVK